ncbi:MAG TPA: aldo/keto reductase [Burkholderiales bacterium]|jgi:aryl-alcohol dehydrogenase-like predicted oxidoreductase
MSKTLPARRLGKNGPMVSALGLGCMSLSGVYGASSDDNGVAVIHRALDQGINFLDTSDMYGWGHNELVVGKALKGRRDGVILASKFGQTKGEGGKNGVNGKPEYVAEACEASLKRMGVDVIDLYYVHRIDPGVPIEDTVGAMAKLVQQGKVKHLGLCEAKPETVRRAHKTHPLAALQTEYSLLYRQEAEESLATTRELGISFVAYSPLGRSLLTATVQTVQDVASDRRADHPRFAAENFDRNRELVKSLEVLARDKNCKPAHVALAWVLAQGDDIIPIPGTKQAARVDENLGALDVKLTPAEVAHLSQVFAQGTAAGTRYPAGGMKGVFI